MPDDRERLLRDSHPADVVCGDKVLATGARVFVTTHRVMVYVADESPGGGVRLAYEMGVEEPLPIAKRSQGRGAIELNAHGHTMWINRGKGCGCRSPLKVMVPPFGW